MWVRSHVQWTNYGQYFSGCPKESFFSLFCFFCTRTIAVLIHMMTLVTIMILMTLMKLMTQGPLWDNSGITVGELWDHCGITLSSPSSLLSLSSLGFLLLERTSGVSPVISSFFCMIYSVCCVCLLYCRVV